MLSLLFRAGRACSFRIDPLRRAIKRKLIVAWLRSKGVRVGARFNATSFFHCVRNSEATIEIGDDVVINNNLFDNAAGISHPTVFVAARVGSRISIGNHVGISGSVVYCTSEIIVEDHVNIGA